MKDIRRCQRIVSVSVKERYVVVDMKDKKYGGERGRKGDYLRENGQNVTVDKKQSETRLSCV